MFFEIWILELSRSAVTSYLVDWVNWHKVEKLKNVEGNRENVVIVEEAGLIAL